MMAKTPRKDPESGAQLTDEELVVEYRTDGDREVFALLVRRYERELYSYLRRYLGSAEMAEDVFQATFLQVHLKCDRFDANRRFRPWLYTVATNQAIDAQRRNKRHRMVSLDRPVSADNVDIGALVDLLEGDERDPLENVSQLERGQWVQDALDGLSESMRSVVHLVYYQGMKYREAAEILDIPVGTVKSRLHAAIIKLYETWDSPEV
jgi:RNA polymerase sigma-70 factor (ECF subfamily)|tara:strand:+ start:170 stop:793 length:624 start_codon:yes stop_codon:yes gene_type:complete